MNERDIGVVFIVVAMLMGCAIGYWATSAHYQKEAIRAGVACYGAVTGKFMWIASAQETHVQEEPRDARKINSGNKDSRIETGNITVKE